MMLLLVSRATLPVRPPSDHYEDRTAHPTRDESDQCRSRNTVVSPPSPLRCPARRPGGPGVAVLMSCCASAGMKRDVDTVRAGQLSSWTASKEARVGRGTPGGAMYGNEGATAVCERPCRARAALVSNQGKSLAIRVGDELWARLPVRTELFERGDDVASKVTRYVDRTVRRTHPGLAIGTGFDKTWYAVVSEKVVAISQGRSYFTWEIRTGLAARVLSRYVARTEYGIGLGCPSTMQLAIQEAGLGRI